ncbi:hypothetical protein ABMA74_12195 [Halobacteriovorax sp. HFRX-1_3]|uniref:hypothetical protein n=1 Tax=Halobacteriovorax sp. HFRX-1_3 TaxID=3157715 RepID=UPI0037129C0D
MTRKLKEKDIVISKRGFQTEVDTDQIGHTENINIEGGSRLKVLSIHENIAMLEVLTPIKNSTKYELKNLIQYEFSESNSLEDTFELESAI